MNENLTAEERIERIASHISEIIELIGEDGSREGLVKTPVRAAKALWFLTSGYRTKAEDVMQQALFAHDGSQMIVVRDIEFYSLCEHHMLPFFGTISVGYLPNGKIIGLSKLARCVEVFARRLQVQERITAELCRAVERELDAEGVMVVCRARHLCMQMRGVEKQNATTVTTHAEGRFANDAALRAEFLQAISSQ
ncbi:MAG: GTP cyclohydrolase I FolE [Muribaculaceae bacterium]|nr:GTP cyclohydrolase I FolE [Muribaculaceae bacterium]MDE6486898.1 GTP cyclohydrolase I FolE [Muribaculaceae bacterium]